MDKCVLFVRKNLFKNICAMRDSYKYTQGIFKKLVYDDTLRNDTFLNVCVMRDGGGGGNDRTTSIIKKTAQANNVMKRSCQMCTLTVVGTIPDATHTHTHTQTHRQRHTDTDTDTHRHRHRHTHTHTHTHRHRQTQTHTHTHTHRFAHESMFCFRHLA